MADNYWVPLRLPGFQDLGKYLLWVSGRAVLSGWLFGLQTLKVTCKVVLSVTEMTQLATLRLVKVYDQLPYMGVAVQSILVPAESVLEEPTEIITDIISAIEGKQVMIIGEMGTGKSTLAQYLAYTVGGSVRVYECEGTPEDWQGLEVIGKGENWNAIEAGMSEDLEDLSNQMKIREQRGDAALTGSEKVLICEEYPELVSKVPSSGEWLERHARRGRKARRFTVLLSQYDRVAAWGIEGKGDLAEAFYRIRLGKKALAHAKSLKNEELTEWLKTDKSHCLLDDQPCKLPLYREMKAVATRPYLNNGFSGENTPKKSPKPAQEADFEESFSEADYFLWRLIQRFGGDKSDSAIVTEVLGMTGTKYSEGKDLLERLRKNYGQ